MSGIDLFRTDLRYPSELHALIEHENGEHLEEEMWKLVHWRSPLKVLIAYDYTEQAKSGDERYAGWLEAKQQSLHRLHAAVGAFCPEAPGTEYLLIVGCRDQALRVLTWRAWRLAPTGWGDALPAGSQSALNPSTSAGTASTANAAGV